MINKIDSKLLNQKYYKNNIYKDKFEDILQKVSKPARYIGVEPYSIHKYQPIELEEKFSENINNKIFQNDHSALDGKNYYYVALTYPDMYEIGMSNLTIKYFYYFINDIKNAICERVFLPDEDLNRLLIEQDIPLLSLESWTPIKNFDLWAFTLQTELTYSNILFLFKLAKISPLSFQRVEEDPIIIVGGVSNFNPLPLSPFVDLFFLGEGEEAIKEIVNLDKENKVKKLSREERIKKLTEIEGVFSFNQIILNHYNDFKNKYPGQKNDNSFDKEKKDTKDEVYSSNKEKKEIKNEDYSADNEKKEIKNENITNINDYDLKFFEFLKDEVKFPDFKEINVKKRIVKDLNKLDYPLVNILPLVQPIQDRLSVEVSRGCLNGCRFCQASFVYRPYREKDPIEVAIFAAKSLFLTGYEECNLTSLSISDYSNVKELIRSMEKYFKDKNISISVPSLRVASFDLDLFDSLSSVRKAGLTFAVEAGCEKIRNKINKEFDEDKFFEIVGSLYARGWKLVKLYFIIGFPDVFDEEDEIINLLKRIKHNFPKLNVNVSIALLIPKPFTPFAFEQQLSLDLFISKVHKIKNAFRNSNISVKYHDPFSSFIEYFYANGSFDASFILANAYNANISFDAWDEKRNKEFYQNMNLYIKKPLCIEEKFDLTSIFEGSVYSNYIKNEKVKYDREELTRSCLDGKCNGCDICKDDVKNIVSKKYNEEEIFNELQNISKNFNYDNLIRTDKKKSYLLKFSKFNQYRYVGHLDFYRTFIRILKIAGIDFEYSQGFNPMPKVFFPFPSSLGMESFEDLLLFESYNEIIDKEYFCKSYNLFLPDGFKFEKIIEIESIKSWRNNANIKQFLIIPFEIKIFDNSRLKVLEKFLNNKVFLILGEKSKKILLEKKIKVLEDEIDINIENDNQNVVQSINGKLKIKTELKENQANIVKLLNAYEEEERFFTQEINISFSNFVKRYINIE